MDAVDSLFEQIENGSLGLNMGLNIGLPKLQSFTKGVKRKTYTVIAGGTGSGKTSFAMYSYVYRVIADHLGDMKYRVVFFSFEMPAEMLLAKMMSLHIWEMYGIEIDYATIMSEAELINEETKELLRSCIPWLKEVMKQLVIIDTAIGADSVYHNLKKYAERNGTETQGLNGKIHYKPNIENELVQIVIDHLGLVKLDKKTKKEEMDLLANYLLTIRNIYSYSPLILMQINRTSSSMDRRKGGYSEIELSDIKDTGTAAEAAELVIALFNPWKEKQGLHKKYNIKILQDHYRAIQVLKNRTGTADKQVSVNFFGSVGLFQELPPAEDLERLSETQLKKYTQLIDIPVDTPSVQIAPVGGFVFKL